MADVKPSLRTWKSRIAHVTDDLLAANGMHSRRHQVVTRTKDLISDPKVLLGAAGAAALIAASTYLVIRYLNRD